jgi:hypothetical protein
MEQRLQALVTLSRRAVMGFALELGVYGGEGMRTVVSYGKT